MKIEVELTERPIVPSGPPSAPEAGAWVEFCGVVRGEEDGRAIAALEYEAYAPMAEREMRRILAELAQRHPCLSVRVVHRLGIVPVGESAIQVGVVGRHRAEAFALLSEFMDRLKRDVPIWKRRALGAGSTALGVGAEVAERGGGKDLAAGASADEVIALVRSLCGPLGTERVMLMEAAGRVLREEVRAPEDQPAFDRSSVDGYAVRCEDSEMRFRLVGGLRAGDWTPGPLAPGEAIRVATGAALPCGGLQVVMREDAEVEEGMVVLRRRGGERNIRFRGEDARAGDGLVSSGTVLRAGALGLLASVGWTRPWVTRRPQVLHVVTGNEIVSPEDVPGPGKIRDSNSALVRAFMGQWGVSVEQRRAGEDEAAIRGAIEGDAGGEGALDLLLISGGASVGEHDFTRRLLEAAGFHVRVSRTRARPGKPLIVAQRGGTLAFGLPGNPLAHFVCLNLYVRAALEAWSGQSEVSGFQTGLLAAEVEGGGQGRETFWPAEWREVEGKSRLQPLRWRSSGDLTALARANALLRVAASAQRVAGGSAIEFLRC